MRANTLSGAYTSCNAKGDASPLILKQPCTNSSTVKKPLLSWSSNLLAVLAM